jgi:hypothetical protein
MSDIKRPTNNTKTIEQISLHQFIFDHLTLSNNKLYRPIQDIYLYYCAQLFEKYMKSENFFSISAVGQIYLEVLADREKLTQERTYAPKLQNIADTSFLICAFFSESKKAKMVGINYYSQISTTSYQQLNHIRPSYLELPNFFSNFSFQFPLLISLLRSIKNENETKQFWQLFGSEFPT